MLYTVSGLQGRYVAQAQEGRGTVTAREVSTTRPFIRTDRTTCRPQLQAGAKPQESEEEAEVDRGNEKALTGSLTRVVLGEATPTWQAGASRAHSALTSRLPRFDLRKATAQP